MNKLFRLLSLLSGLGACVASAQADSKLIFADDWASRAAGTVFEVHPWQVTSLERGYVEITDHRSPFGDSRRSLRVVHEDQTSWGPRLRRDFPVPVTGALEIGFDFYLDEPSDDQPTFFLLGSRSNVAPGAPSNAINLVLQNQNNFSVRGKNIVNRPGPGPTPADPVAPVLPGRWHRVLLRIAPPSAGTYDITVTPPPGGGAPVEIKGLKFQYSVTDYTGILFSTNAGRGSGAITLANLTVRHAGGGR